MASRVDFSVSATPVFTHTAGEGQADVDSIAADVGKSIGGSGSVTTTWGTTEGYLAGDPVHKIVTTAVSLDTLTNIKFLFIKHSGFEDDAKTTANTASELHVMLASDTVKFACLAAGDSIILPYATAESPDIRVKTSTGTIAVEYMATF